MVDSRRNVFKDGTAFEVKLVEPLSSGDAIVRMFVNLKKRYGGDMTKTMLEFSDILDKQWW
jgi:hypothetical protein